MGLIRKSLLQGRIGPPSGKSAKLRISRDGFKAGRIESRTDRKRDGLNLLKIRNPNVRTEIRTVDFRLN